jgi:hypothetical protein
MKSYQLSTLWEESLSQIHSYLPHQSTISLRMVNSREPVEASRTRSACASQRFFKTQKVIRPNLNVPVTLQGFWLLVDGFYMWACPLLGISPFRCVASQFLIYSWEFLITLDSRLGMECHSRAPPTAVDDMSFSLFLSVLPRHVSGQQSDLLIW